MKSVEYSNTCIKTICIQVIILEPNGHIIAYQLQISSNSSAMDFNTSATQHTLRDLTPNTVVVLSVRAYTIIGPGENVTDQASTTSVREFILSSFA